MVTARFAAAETRINQAVSKHLSNVVAQLDGVDVAIIFDRTYLQAFTGIASTDPQALLPTASVGAATTSSLLIVSGTTYRVRSIQADGTGMTLLQLERQ